MKVLFKKPPYLFAGNMLLCNPFFDIGSVLCYKIENRVFIDGGIFEVF